MHWPIRLLAAEREGKVFSRALMHLRNGVAMDAEEQKVADEERLINELNDAAKANTKVRPCKP